MKLRLIALFAAPLLAGGCATTIATRPSAAPPVFEKGMFSAADPRAAEAGAEILRQPNS